MNISKACCFIGHRKINQTPWLINNLAQEVEFLISQKEVSTFYFGSKSDFNDLCLTIVTDLKNKYPHIQRIYVRSAYPDISDSYEAYLLESYDKTYFPEKIRDAGKASYVERNHEMINKSDFCVVYYDENYTPPRRKNSRQDLTDYQPKSGTKVAIDYAKKQNICIKNVFLPDNS